MPCGFLYSTPSQKKEIQFCFSYNPAPSSHTQSRLGFVLLFKKENNEQLNAGGIWIGVLHASENEIVDCIAQSGKPASMCSGGAFILAGTRYERLLHFPSMGWRGVVETLGLCVLTKVARRVVSRHFCYITLLHLLWFTVLDLHLHHGTVITVLEFELWNSWNQLLNRTLILVLFRTDQWACSQVVQWGSLWETIILW